jgi:hypothetical protein
MLRWSWVRAEKRPAKGDREIFDQAAFQISVCCFTAVPGFLLQEINASELNFGHFLNLEHSAKNQCPFLKLGLVGFGCILELKSLKICIATLGIDVQSELLKALLDNCSNNDVILLRLILQNANKTQ